MGIGKSRGANRAESWGSALFRQLFSWSSIHADPDRVEQLTFILQGRNFNRADKATELLFEEIGSLIALLWITHDRAKPRETLQTWIADPHTFEAELSHAINISGGALALKYREENPADKEIAERAQEFFAWAVEAMADEFTRYLDEVQQRQPTETEKERGTLYDGSSTSFVIKFILLQGPCGQTSARRLPWSPMRRSANFYPTCSLCSYVLQTPAPPALFTT